MITAYDLLQQLNQKDEAQVTIPVQAGKVKDHLSGKGGILMTQLRTMLKADSKVMPKSKQTLADLEKGWSLVLSSLDQLTK